jgi:hypothetical protein
MHLMLGIFTLSLPLILATAALLWEGRKGRGEARHARALMVSLQLNALLFLGLGLLDMHYPVPARIFEDIRLIMCVVTSAQAITFGVVRGIAWKGRTLSLVGTVILLLFWYQNQFMS